TLLRALRASREADPVLTVTSTAYRHLTHGLYGLIAPEQVARHQLLLEPSARNTAPAIVLAALWVQANCASDATLLVLPADHLIRDVDAFLACAVVAEALALEGHLVTFGIPPTRAETGYGYIQRGAALTGGFAVARFVEKPDAATAAGYVASGEYFWNAGMFCFRADALLDAAARTCPEVLAVARACFAATAAVANAQTWDAATFARIPEISIDYAVMERADNVAVVPATFDWNDIGSWAAIGEEIDADDDGNRGSGDRVLIGARNCHVQANSRMVAAVGVSDLTIIETADAVLVAHRDHAQDVKRVVDALRERAHPTVDVHVTTYRPWGSYTILEDADDCKVKRLTVKPGHVLSLQMHHRRSEHWTVVSGTAKVRVGDDEFLLERNQSTYIPVETLHRLENATDRDLHLIEVQCGDYFGEDDIVRLEDRYGRV
ncbi:MAG: mannose-1-phosphate guanylyltransferase/mannose-6-phosphate isomerase, partial [Lysobacterales bacterium]